MNFTLDEWNHICSSIDPSDCFNISKIPELPAEKKWIAIKHDVETDVKKAKKIAKIEAKYNIKATYYVQSYLLDNNHKDLKEISDMGHEVSYHYDVLDSNFGDIKKAISEFSQTIEDFKKYGFEVQTVCPHGNPLMSRVGWSSNKDFFRNKKISNQFPEIFDIVVHGQNKIKSDYNYVSDAGYKFQIITDITHNDLKKIDDKEISDTKELIRLANSNKSLILSTHPHRWNSNVVTAWITRTRFLTIRKFALLASKSKLMKKIMSKFYFLAKKL